jgi:3-hydroxyisobutyrate dehydrogenase-like beta-hydroxyacid dehydrogenase
VHTTAELATIEAVARQAAEHGVVVLDAGVTGGEPGAQAGRLITMVGGPEAAVARVRPVLDTFSREVIHAGPLGAGMSLKLARNAAGYIMMAAVHEAMTLAKRSGVDLNVLEHVLTESGVAAQALAPFMLGGPDPLTPGEPEELRASLEHTNRLAEKDIDQARALAARLNVAVPALEATRASFRRVVRLDSASADAATEENA